MSLMRNQHQQQHDRSASAAAYYSKRLTDLNNVLTVIKCFNNKKIQIQFQIHIISFKKGNKQKLEEYRHKIA